MIIDKFTQALESLIGKTSNKKIAVAVSGGSDSISLLHLLADKTNKNNITAITVNHNLREESAIEANKVSQWAEEIGVKHKIILWDHPDIVPGNIQAEARKARYKLMGDYCNQHDIKYILLGHTQDDQEETIAIMQERASGPVGLAGMSATRDVHGIKLVRPLLKHSRQELRNWLKSRNLEWIDDPSNENTDFTRVRIRKELSENLERQKRLLALGNEMGKKRTLIEKAHKDFIKNNININNGTLTCPLKELLDLGEEQSAYVIGRIILHVGGNEYPPRYKKRLRLIKDINNPECKKTMLGNCLIHIKNNDIIFTPEKDITNIEVKPLVPSPFTTIFTE